MDEQFKKMLTARSFFVKSMFFKRESLFGDVVKNYMKRLANFLFTAAINTTNSKRKGLKINFVKT